MELISNGLLLAAAMTAIFYCFAINRRLGAIRRQSADLTVKLGALDDTVSRVETLIARSRDQAETESSRLNELCSRSDTLRRDLRLAIGAFETARAEAEAASDAEQQAVAQRVRKKEEPLARIKRLQGTDRRRSAS